LKLDELRSRLIEIRDNHQRHFDFSLKTMKSRQDNLHETNQSLRRLILDTDKEICDQCTTSKEHCGLCTIRKEIEDLEKKLA
jgi:hypothetical protein